MILDQQSLSPWWAALAVAASSAAGALLAGIAAYTGVSRRKKGEHEDIRCRRFMRAFESFHDGIIIVDRDLRILEANRQARGITGYGNELVGRSVYDLIPDRYREHHRSHVQRFFNDPHTRKMGVAPMELWLIDRRGIEKRMDLSLSPAEDDYGSFEVTVGMRVVQD